MAKLQEMKKSFFNMIKASLKAPFKVARYNGVNNNIPTRPSYFFKRGNHSLLRGSFKASKSKFVGGGFGTGQILIVNFNKNNLNKKNLAHTPGLMIYCSQRREGAFISSSPKKWGMALANVSNSNNNSSNVGWGKPPKRPNPNKKPHLAFCFKIDDLNPPFNSTYPDKAGFGTKLCNWIDGVNIPYQKPDDDYFSSLAGFTPGKYNVPLTPPGGKIGAGPFRYESSIVPYEPQQSDLGMRPSGDWCIDGYKPKSSQLGGLDLENFGHWKIDSISLDDPHGFYNNVLPNLRLLNFNRKVFFIEDLLPPFRYGMRGWPDCGFESRMYVRSILYTDGSNPYFHPTNPGTF